jgi:hypothetical protein
MFLQIIRSFFMIVFTVLNRKQEETFQVLSFSLIMHSNQTNSYIIR